MKWISKNQAAALIGLSPHTLRRYRERGIWQEGIHYSKPSQNSVVYNERLILNWIANRHNPIAHEQAIERYLSDLSNDGKTAETESTQRKRKRQQSR